MPTLTYDGTNYQAKLEDGRILFVDGDVFGEDRHDMALVLLREKHPELDQDAALELLSEEGDQEETDAFKADREAFSALIDSNNWIDYAVEVNAEGEPLEAGAPSNIVAWIKAA